MGSYSEELIIGLDICVVALGGLFFWRDYFWRGLVLEFYGILVAKIILIKLIRVRLHESFCPGMTFDPG